MIADFRGYSRISESRSKSRKQHGLTIYLATPRIQKPDEMGIFRAMAKHGADGILVRNLAGMAFCAEQIICRSSPTSRSM